MKDLSFKKYLTEMPLPADWDKSKIGGKNSFKSQIAYAKEKAKKIGAGSSRVAFVIPYDGRNTVLKIAKNQKGLAQNQHEADMFNDYLLKGLNITIPMIDFDEESASPTWIHVEYATKAKDSDFKKLTGLNLGQLVTYCRYISGNFPRLSMNVVSELEESVIECDLVTNLADLIGSWGIPIGDIERLANWGIYQGRPVIIDLGLSKDIWAQFYSK